MNEKSHTEVLLKGKTMPGYTSPIASITKKGDRRFIRLESGTVVQRSKKQLKQIFHTVLQEKQFKSSIRTIRESASGGVTAKVGGLEKGKKQHYESKARAIAALKRRYKQ